MKSKDKRTEIPSLQTYFAPVASSSALSKHLEKGKKILKRVLPDEFFLSSSNKAADWFSNNLPLIKWDSPAMIPDSFSIFFFCSPTEKVKAEKVLPDLIRKWLILEKEVEVLSFYNVYFNMREISSALFFLAEIQIFVEDERDWELIQKRLPLLSDELNLCLSSTQYLERILDTKALSLDQKASQIQYYLRKLMHRLPGKFDTEIFQEMSSFFALSNPELRKFRQPRHLTRILVSHYVMRKRLLHALSLYPEKRHVDFRFIRSKLHFAFGSKFVLGLSVVVKLGDKYESFEDTHILSAVQKFIPNAQVVKDSHYFYRSNHDPIKRIYLELEKSNGLPFKPEEIQLLKSELKEELKNRIEKLIPSVFMVRNEEEVMRNILLLSQELKYLSDLPQVMIHFDKQDEDDLHFTVLVVRVLKKHDLTLDKAFKRVKESFRFVLDRVQNVGYIRKKNPKEANVFHLLIRKDRSFLRADSSVNFYSARQKVISIIHEALGEVRDYNGGMILKQGELFSQLKHAFDGIVKKNQELLENFFFGINPIEAQATAALSAIKTLFKLCFEATENELTKRESYFLKTKKQKNFIFTIIRVKESSFSSVLNDELNQLKNFSKSLVRTQIFYQGTFLYALMYETSDSNFQNDFQRIIHSALNKWVNKIINQQELRLSFMDLPPSLDPRLGGQEYASTLNKMLFEGLTRVAKDGKPALAIAKSIDISADQKRYVFKLRPSYWSNGKRLVAYDFEYAWKKILSPSFYTPFTYFFYPIKNAKAAKEGEVDLKEVGIKAIDENTLEVELVNPSPEFLEVLAHSLYSPVNHQIDARHPNWGQSRAEEFVCNGPFKLNRILSNRGYEMVQNPNYWDESSVKLNKIVVSKNTTEAAFEMYKNDEIDWIGQCLHPWEPHFSKEPGVMAEPKPIGLMWCVFNTQRYPFDNLKMREAFYYAADRQKIVKQLSDELFPALSPVPTIHSQIKDRELGKGDKERARMLFKEALGELGITQNEFPILTLCFTGGEGRKETARLLIQEWESTLKISCRLERYEYYTLFSKMVKGEFQVGNIAWKAWINDPSYTLDVFEYRNNKVNFPKWEHPEYQKLLNHAKKEVILENRHELYLAAEKILIQECPILPLHDDSFKYMHKKRLKNVISSDLGNIDFKETSIVPD